MANKFGRMVKCKIIHFQGLFMRDFGKMIKLVAKEN